MALKRGDNEGRQERTRPVDASPRRFVEANLALTCSSSKLWSGFEHPPPRLLCGSTGSPHHNPTLVAQRHVYMVGLHNVLHKDLSLTERPSRELLICRTPALPSLPDTPIPQSSTTTASADMLRRGTGCQALRRLGGVPPVHIAVRGGGGATMTGTVGAPGQRAVQCAAVPVGGRRRRGLALDLALVVAAASSLFFLAGRSTSILKPSSKVR